MKTKQVQIVELGRATKLILAQQESRYKEVLEPKVKIIEFGKVTDLTLGIGSYDREGSRPLRKKEIS